MKMYVCALCFLMLSMVSYAETRLCVNKQDMNISVLDGDSLIAQYPIACGKALGDKVKSGDMRTPEGEFTIVSIVNSRAWAHDFGDGKGLIEGAYGPWFMRLSYGKGIGIHGTHDPSSMGKRATEGCIRLRNEDLIQLKKMVRKGTKVTILKDN